MKYNKKISLVIPTLNEEKNLPIVLEEIPDYIDEIIIVDGYSKDNTVEIAKKYNCRIFYDDVGKGSSLIMGVEQCTGDYVIMMDADWSHRIEELSLFIEGLEMGYDFVMGSRFLQGGGTADMTPIRRLGNKLFVIIVNMFFGMNYSDLCYGYRAFRRDIFNKLNLKSKGFAIETEISIKAAKCRLKILEVPSFEKKRKYGKGNLQGFRDGLRISGTILTEILTKWTKN